MSQRPVGDERQPAAECVRSCEANDKLKSMTNELHTPPDHQVDLERWDRENYWHAFTQMAEYQPFIIERGEGAWLETLDGQRFLDGCSSMWCNVHGHRHPRIDAAIREQLDKVAHVTSLGASNSTTIRLTQKLVETAPRSRVHEGQTASEESTDSDLTKVFYSSDGSSAVEVALKQAFQYWRQKATPEPQRDLFLALGGSYHGDTLGSVSVGGVTRFHAMFAPLLFETVHGPCPDSYRVPEGVSPSDLCSHYLVRYRELFERFGERFAGVVVEPLVQGAAGMVMHPTGFLSGIRELCDEYGTLLIADEIAVGMGRTGTLWACENEFVVPDFLCTGKGLSGGYLPVAATLTSQKIWDAFLGEYSQSKSFFHGHTFGGNPLGSAAALATLELFDELDLLPQIADRSKYLQAALEPLSEHPEVGDVRCCGLIGAVELVQNKHTQQGYPWGERKGHQVCEAALKHNVWLRPLGNVVVVMPPLCITESELDQIAAAIQFGLNSVM